MKAIRISLHSVALTVVDIAGIGGGAVVAYKALGVSNQVWLQLPCAIVLSLVLFAAWVFLLQFLGFRRLQFVGERELVACLAASLLWAPLVFVPLHYFTQGYLTSMGNLVALAGYQLPVNSLALFGLWGIQRSRAGSSTQNAVPNRPTPPQDH